MNKITLPGFTAHSALYKGTQTFRQISNTFIDNSRSLLTLQLKKDVGPFPGKKECCCDVPGNPNMKICEYNECDDCCNFSCYCGGPDGDTPSTECRCPWWCGAIGGNEPIRV